MAAATAGTASVNAEEDIFRDADGCSGFRVRCTSGTLLVHVDGLHKDGEFAPVVANEAVEFIHGDLGIRRVRAKGSGGAAGVNWTVTRKLTHA